MSIRHISLRIKIGLIIAGFVLHACSSWQPASNMSVLKKDGKTIRVQMKSGETIETRRYYFIADTLVIKAPNTLVYKGEDRKIPPEKIAGVEVLYIDEYRSLLLLGFSSVIIYALWETMHAYGEVISAMGV